MNKQHEYIMTTVAAVLLLAAALMVLGAYLNA